MALKVLMLVVSGIANLILGNYIINKNSLIRETSKNEAFNFQENTSFRIRK